jgi:signal transduction histidine kinase
MVEVGESFNHMLDSIAASEEALQRKRIEKHKLEQQLRHKEKLAAIGRLAAGVAHELGTPLSVIRGRAQRVLRKKDLAPELTADLDHVIRQVSRMSDIVRQLLDFSRPDQMRFKPIDPIQIARSAAAAVSRQAHDLAAQLDMAPMHDLPALTADPVRLEQALVNLLCNALQAGDQPTVRLSCEQKDRWVGFKVEDDGPGIPHHLRDRVFEPFFTTKPVGGGTGLGLAVVHGIIQEHGGRIDLAESSLGGASFSIWLPLHADRRQEGK